MVLATVIGSYSPIPFERRDEARGGMCSKADIAFTKREAQSDVR